MSKIAFITENLKVSQSMLAALLGITEKTLIVCDEGVAPKYGHRLEMMDYVIRGALALGIKKGTLFNFIDEPEDTTSDESISLLGMICCDYSKDQIETMLVKQANKWNEFIEEKKEANVDAYLVSKLALKFSFVLMDNLSYIQIKKIVMQNRKDGYDSGICASHDHCDANMYMLDAFQEVVGCDVDYSTDESIALWNAAWDMAKSNDFYTEF